MTRWILGGLAVAVAVVVLTSMFAPSDVDQDRSTHRGPAQVIGQALPDVTVARLGGGDIALNDFRGRDVLVNVWATWCGPCRREMPALERLAKEQNGRLLVVAIDQGEDPTAVKPYTQRFGITFPIGLDADQQVGTVLHMVGMPSSFFVDRAGVIRDAVDGEMTYETMNAKAHTLVAGG